jgi:virginiamycin A acetyltransferase
MAPPASRWSIARLRAIAGGYAQGRIARVLDQRPVRFPGGPVNVGREVIGWRDADWKGRNQVNVGSVLVGSVVVGVGSRLGAYNYVEGPVEIGRFTTLGANVALLGGGGHPMRTAANFTSPTLFDGRRRDLTVDAPVVVGHDVWLGHGATVVGPVRIGHGAVIGAGSVVTHDVAALTVVAGSPARLIRPRFDPEVERLLLALAWWDLEPDELIPFEALLALDLTADPAAACDALRAAIDQRNSRRVPGA